MPARFAPTNDCLICRGAQELVLGIAERGPHERMHDYSRVLFCAACGIGEVRSYSYDDFVVYGEEDDVMTWSGVLEAAEVDRLRGLLRDCPSTGDHQCSCAVHQKLRWSCERTRKTLLPEYGPDRNSPAGRVVLTIELDAEGLPVFAGGL